MKLRTKWTMGLLSLGAAVVVGVSATAVYAQTAIPDQTLVAGQLRFHRGEDHNALLAEALGISEEALQAAMTTAGNAAIDQAVADGQITQEQAGQIKAGESGRGRGWGPVSKVADHEEQLAEALGITVAELQAAKAEAQDRLLDEAVATGEMTQAEADLLTARQALQGYLRDRMQSAYDEAVAQAVAEGVITQAQADQILSEQGPGFFGPRMFGPGMFGPPIDDARHGGHGDGPARGPNGDPGRGRGQTPKGTDSDTPEASNDAVVPSTSLSL